MFPFNHGAVDMDTKVRYLAVSVVVGYGVGGLVSMQS